MELKVATVEVFDTTTGKGVLRLEEDCGAIPVHFAVDVCRGVIPRAGLRVLAGHLGPEPGSGGPFSETFALRAGLIEPDVGAGNVETVPTIGITKARPGISWTGKPVVRVPFDPSMFPGLRTAFREDLVATLTFGSPVPAPTAALPDYLRPLAGLCSVARRAPRFRISRGQVPVGSTFVGGNCADIGDVPWPVGTAGPMYPVLQIGLSDARKIGLDDQINVFFNPAEPSEYPVESMVPGSIRQQVPGPYSQFHVIACGQGRRATTSDGFDDAAPLTLIEEVSIFPDVIGLQSAYKSQGQDLPVDVTRFWAMQVARSPNAGDEDYRSIHEVIAKWFPTTCDVDGDVILGGFSALHVQEGAPFKRLATFSTTSFDWLNDLAGEWEKAALEVSFDGPSVRAWLHGTN